MQGTSHAAARSTDGPAQRGLIYSRALLVILREQEKEINTHGPRQSGCTVDGWADSCPCRPLLLLFFRCSDEVEIQAYPCPNSRRRQVNGSYYELPSTNTTSSQTSRTRNAGNCHEYNLGSLWLVGDATSNASYTVPCLRCTWAWFARASCWLVARRHRAAPAQYGRSDHGAPHAAPATTRGLLLVYVCCCLCPLLLRLLARIDRKPPSYSYIL